MGYFNADKLSINSTEKVIISEDIKTLEGRLNAKKQFNQITREC